MPTTRYTVGMDRKELHERLTNHLAGDDSFDLHDAAARSRALNDAYDYISEKYALWEGNLLPSSPLPDDFYSYGKTPGKYNRRPPPLATDASQPWGGTYPHLHKYITPYAAYLLYRDKGPEMYERASYWLSVFGEDEKTIERTLKRQGQDELADGAAANEETLGGLRTVIDYYLDTGDLTPEFALRAFPRNIREGAIQRVYRELNREFALTAGVERVTTSSSGVTVTPAPDDFEQFAGPAQVGDTTVFIDQPHLPNHMEVYTEGAERYIRVTHEARGGREARIPYVAVPPPLVNQSDKPWHGLYPAVNKLISLRAMRDLLRGHSQTYNLSRFWENEYNNEVREVKRALRAQRPAVHRVLWGYAGNDSRPGFAPINYREGN